MKKLLTYITILLSISSLAFAKINTIKDDFLGTEYYTTEHININWIKADFDNWGQIRFRTANGNPNKITMDIVISSGAGGKIFSLDKLYIKFMNDNVLEGEPYNNPLKISSSGINFSYMGSGMQFILFKFELNDRLIEAIKSGTLMLRAENNNSYNNINVSKKESQKIIKTLDELLKFVEDKK